MKHQLTFQTKDEGYCSSDSSNCSECSMDSMEGIISGIEALLDSDESIHKASNWTPLFIEPFVKGSNWIPLDMDICTRNLEPSWTERAKYIKYAIDAFEAEVIPDYRLNKKRKEEEFAICRNIVDDLVLNCKKKPTKKRPIHDTAIVDCKMEPARKIEMPPELELFSRIQIQQEDASIILKQMLGIPF